MTTTARIAVTLAADTYAASIAAGAVGNFKAFGLGINEVITVQGKNAAGAFEDLTYVDPGGRQRRTTLEYNSNSLRLIGPIDFQISKPATTASVGVDEYS